MDWRNTTDRNIALCLIIAMVANVIVILDEAGLWPW